MAQFRAGIWMQASREDLLKEFRTVVENHLSQTPVWPLAGMQLRMRADNADQSTDIP